jgi:hypothetical protein
MLRRALLAGLSIAGVASAHPEGFHARYVFTVERTQLTGLLVLDVDSGERCELLRAGADVNHDGLLAREERAALEKKVASLITRPLKLAISGYPLPLTIKDTKLNLRDDQRVSRTAISVALLLEVKHPYDVSPGMHLEVETVTPDASPLRLEVFQASQPGDPGEPPFRQEVESGKKVRVRLGALAKPDAG